MAELLAETGWSGHKIKRETLDAAFAAVGVVAQNTKLHVVTGEALGLWVRSDGGTRRGTIRVLTPGRRQDLPSVSPATA